MDCVKWKSAFKHPPNAKIQIILRIRKVLFGPLLPIHSVIDNDSFSGKWRPWSDCADAQADLGIRCPQMPEDTFSYGSAHTRQFSEFVEEG